MDISFILDRIQSYGDEVAVVADGKQYTFRDILNQYHNSLALLDKENIPNNSAVAVHAEFNSKSIAMFLALLNKDCIFVPLSLGVKSVEKCINIAQCQALLEVSDNEIIVKKTGIEISHPMLKGLVSSNKPGLVLFSSGTTGEPKAALHDITFLLERFKKTGKKLSTVTFLLYDHIGGFNTMVYTLVNGGLMVTLKDRTADEVCSLIEKYKLDLLPTSASFINLIILNQSYKKYDLSSLKTITYGTEPMPQSTLDAMHSIMPNVQLKQTYGLSEVGIMPTKSENSSSLWMKLRNDENFQTKIVDDILYIKSKSAMIGYLNHESPFDADGWFNTKDKVIVKGDFVKILGRTTDLINVGGQKVYPIDVESEYLKCAGVKDIRVFGVSNPILGQVVSAEVEVSPENNNRDFIKELRRFGKEHLDSYKIPTNFKLTENALYSERFKKKR